MARGAFAQSSFSAGQLGRDLEGRSDVDAYSLGARLLRNCQPRAQGGVVSRPGSRFVEQLPAGSVGRSVGFSFNAQQTYTVVITADEAAVNPGAIRFYRDSAVLIDPSDSLPYTIASDYTAAEIQTLSFIQSADVLYIFCPTKPVRELRRLADTAMSVSWQLVDAAFADGPYGEVNTGATTLVVSSGTATAGATGIEITASAALFAAGDVGRQLRIRKSDNTGNWAWATITAFTSATVVEVTVGPDTPFDATLYGGSAVASTHWRLGAFSATTGYPRAGAFEGGRLWMGATTSRPQTLFASVAGDIASFAPSQPSGTVADDSAIVLTIDDDRVNRIEWLLPAAGVLLVGTSGGEFVVRARSRDSVITPTNATAFRQTAYGSAASVQAVKVGPAAMFVERGSGVGRSGGRRLREMLFRFDEDQYVAEDQTLRCGELLHAAPPDLASDLAGQAGSGGVIELALQTTPATRLWCLRADGVLASYTYEPSQSVRAWSETVLGGSCPDELGREPGRGVDGEAVEDASGGRVESISVIRDDETAQDQLWMVVRRRIDGQDVRFVEFLLPEPELADRQEDAVHVDASLSLSGWHAGGQTLTVAVDADGVATVTASGNVFAPTDVGRTLGLQRSADAGGPGPGPIVFIEIDSYASATSVQLAAGHGLAASTTTVFYRWGWPAVSNVSGLSHLEGQLVAVMVDGGLDGMHVVDGGQVPLANVGMVVHVGLVPQVRLWTMPMVLSGNSFTSRGRRVSLSELRVRLLRSVPVDVSLRTVDDGRREQSPFRTLMPLRNPVDGTLTAQPLQSGEFREFVSLGMAGDQIVEIRPTAPLPMRVLAIAGRGEIEE